MISVLHSIFWILLFVLSFVSFENNIKLICGFLLVIYLLIAQPLKDWSMMYFFRKKKVKWKLKEFDVLSGFDNTNKIEYCFPLLKSVLQKLKIVHVDFYIFISKPLQVRIFSERTAKTITFDPKSFQKNEELIAYIRSDPWGKNIVEYPSEFRDYLAIKKIYCIIPIFFRNMMLGIFTFSCKLEKQQIQILESVGRRLSLIIHNRLLNDKINLSKEIEKTFLIARKMEFFLESSDHIQIFNYELEKNKDAWRKKYFPVYYEVKNQKILINKKNQKSYMILCRPSKNLQKGAIINLCLVQGYFISLCESSSSLLKLMKSLQSVLVGFLNQNIYLEGFILLLQAETLDIHYFGKQLNILKNSKSLQLQDSAPLGSESWEISNLLGVHFPDEITFLIRGYPLITIKQKNYRKLDLKERNLSSTPLNLLKEKTILNP